MGFGESIRTVFGKYAVFNGRARRSEFWWFYLFTAIVNGVLGGILGVALLSSPRTKQTIDGVIVEQITPNAFAIAMYVLIGIWALAILLPTLAVQVRRLHDTDRVGWWWWLGWLCCVGPIILIVFFILEGTRGPNRFGPDPREV